MDTCKFIRPGYISSFEALKRLNSLFCGRNITVKKHLFYLKFIAEIGGKILIKEDLVKELSKFPFIKVRFFKNQYVAENELVGFCSITEKFIPENSISYLENFGLRFGLLVSVNPKDHEYLESVQKAKSNLPNVKLSNLAAKYLDLTDGDTILLSTTDDARTLVTVSLPKLIH